jgi:8-amino-7-oxononanoate synthase
VPPGTARLRVTLSAAHTEDHVSLLLEALAAIAPSPATDVDETLSRP